MMNRFYEKFAFILENKELIAPYLLKYLEKQDTLKEYLIAMTPRSGSSWLTELIVTTNVAGNPEEWFNHYHLDGILKIYQCTTLKDYLRCIKGAQSTPNDVFGLEATFYQLNLLLEGCAFSEIFNNSLKVIYLTRNNFIKQGISLYKAIISDRYHAHQNLIDIPEIPYDAEKIKYWILHILHQEYYWERLFLKEKIAPLRISYEQLVAAPQSCVQQILDCIGVEDFQYQLPQETKHQKISDRTSQEFFELFQENKDFIEACQKYRGAINILDIVI